MFYDTHAHILMTSRHMAEGPVNLLTDLFTQEGIKEFPFILDIGTEGGDLKNRRDFFCGKIPDNVFFTAGIWPSKTSIENQDLEIKKLLEDLENIKKYKIIGIGEAGFDRRENDTTNGVNLMEEKRLFLRQIEVAKAKNLPVIVHSRDAYKETYETISESGYSKGVIHCFSYGVDMAREDLDMGFYLGVGGVVTFSNARKLKEVTAYAPMDRILLETDCPYLAPVPNRGKRNSSLYLPAAAEAIAAIKGISAEDVIRITWDNAVRMYGLTVPAL